MYIIERKGDKNLRFGAYSYEVRDDIIIFYDKNREEIGFFNRDSIKSVFNEDVVDNYNPIKSLEDFELDNEIPDND